MFHVSRTDTRNPGPAADRLRHGQLLDFLRICQLRPADQRPAHQPHAAQQRRCACDTGSTQPQKAAASADDKIPKGTFEKAPNGALADRDYSGTRLDPEKARDLINAYRKDKGLKPLKLNTSLTEAAKNHSRDLAKWDRISHYGSDGSNPWDRVKRVGYNAKLAAENVGTGQVTIDEVMKGWQTSPGHNKNLLLSDASRHGHRPGAGQQDRVQDLLDAGGRLTAVARRLRHGAMAALAARHLARLQSIRRDRLAEPRLGPVAHHLGHASPGPAAPRVALQAVERRQEVGDVGRQYAVPAFQNRNHGLDLARSGGRVLVEMPARCHLCASVNSRPAAG